MNAPHLKHMDTTDNNRINKGVRPQPSLAAAAIALCVSPYSVGKFHELMMAHTQYEKNPSPELGNYIALTLDTIALELRISMAEREIKNSARSQNGTVSSAD